MKRKIFEHSILEDLKELFIFKPDNDRAIIKRVLQKDGGLRYFYCKG